MFIRLLTAVFALAAVLLVTAAHAQKGDGNLFLIATQTIDASKDSETIDLSKSQGKYRGLRLRSSDGEITLQSVKVLYGDGSAHTEDRKIVLLDGERTRPIDPDGKDRFVDQVTLSIVPAKKGKVTLQVWGIATDDGARAKRPAAPVAEKKPEKKDEGESAKVAAAATKPEAKGQPAAAGAGDFGDVLFGSQTVGFIVDRDVIRVGSEIGKFDKVRLRVHDADIFIKEMKVVYANGEADEIVVNSEVKRDTRTKWFPLKGDRFIKEIQFVYNSKPNFRGQARVEALGEYAEGWLDAAGEGRKFNQGWVLLGAETAGFIGFDKDIIKVGRNAGGFRRLRVTVKERAISLNELRIVYSSGQEDVVPVKTKVDAGSTYGPIDLKGGSRAIKEIQARYRSRFIDKDAAGKGRALVEIWGQH